MIKYSQKQTDRCWQSFPLIAAQKEIIIITDKTIITDEWNNKSKTWKKTYVKLLNNE